MLAVKPPRLSTRPGQKAGKISFKMQCQIQMAQICGRSERSSKVWTVLLMPTHQTKQCPTTVVPSPTSNPKPTFSYTTMPGLANLTCHELIKISTVNSKNDSTHHPLTMNAVVQFKWRWVIIYHQKDEVQRSSWPWQHSTFISQVTRSFDPPGITMRIQLILFSSSLSTYLESCDNHSITERWEIS